MGWRAMQASAVSVVALLSTATAHSQTLYCPWADAVLKLTFSEDQKTVTLVTSLGDVPTPGDYVLAKSSRPPSGTVVFRFVIHGTAFTYRFEIEEWEDDRYMLISERARTNGEEIEERRHCLAE